MIGRRNLGARLFNVSSMLSNMLVSADGKQVVVHLVNYSNYPVEAVTVHLLGEFHLFKSDIPQAIAEFEKEIELNPGFAGVYDRMGDAYTHLEKFDDAQRMLQRSVALDPNSTGPFILLGKVMLKKNDPKSAAMYLQRAAKMDPNNYMTHHLLGQAYRSLGQENDAAREFKIAEQLQKRTE